MIARRCNAIHSPVIATARPCSLARSKVVRSAFLSPTRTASLSPRRLYRAIRLLPPIFYLFGASTARFLLGAGIERSAAVNPSPASPRSSRRSPPATLLPCPSFFAPAPPPSRVISSARLSSAPSLSLCNQRLNSAQDFVRAFRADRVSHCAKYAAV